MCRSLGDVVVRCAAPLMLAGCLQSSWKLDPFPPQRVNSGEARLPAVPSQRSEREAVALLLTERPSFPAPQSQACVTDLNATPNTERRFPMVMVRPDPAVHYPMPLVMPDPTIDCKILVIPDCNPAPDPPRLRPVPALPAPANGPDNH